MKVWCALADRAALGRWTHPTSLEGVRGSRLGELAQRLGKLSMSPNAHDTRPRLASGSAADWFGEIASAEIESTKAAIGLAKAFNQAVKPYSWQSARPTLKIIPSREGTLYCPDDIVVAPSGQDVPGRPAAADELTADENSRGTLIDILGVKSVLAEDWLPIIDQALQAAVQSGSDAHWRTFWRTLRCASADQQIQFSLSHRLSILMLCQDGTWRHADAVLLLGKVVSADDQEEQNGAILVDPRFHGADQQTLRVLGVSDIPSQERLEIPAKNVIYRGSAPRKDIQSVLRQWVASAFSSYRNLPNGNNPYPHSYFPDFALPAGFVLLGQLRNRANARLARLLLDTVEDYPKTLTLKHNRHPKDYPIVEIEHPLRWLLSHDGSLEIGAHAIPMKTVLARIESPVLERLTQLDAVMPTLRSMAKVSSSQPTRSNLALLRQALFEHLATPERVRSGDLTELWDGAASDGWVPECVPGPHGDVSLGKVYVTGSADLARRARDRGWVAVELDEVARKRWLGQGAQSLDDAFKVGWAETLAPVGLLQDAIPDIAVVLAKDQADQTYTQSVQGPHLSIEDHPDPVSCIHWQGVLYLDPGQLDTLPRQDRLLLVLREASTAGWLNCGPDEAIRRIADATLDGRRAEVAAVAGLPGRLLQAVGGDVEALMAALGERACSALPPDAEPLQVAGLALALLGPTVLQALREVLEAADLRPPKYWGTEEARTFVLELGFPESPRPRAGMRSSGSRGRYHYRHCTVFRRRSPMAFGP